MLLKILLTGSVVSQSVLWMSGRTRCSRLPLDIFCPAPHPHPQTWNQSISSTDTCFFSVGGNIPSLESGCQGSHCDWIGHYIRSFPVAELGNIICLNSFLVFFFNIFIWLCWVLDATLRIFDHHCSMQNL